MKNTYIVTIEKISDNGQELLVKKENFWDKLYRMMTGIAYACYAIIFLLPIVWTYQQRDVLVLWMASFSFITALAYSDISFLKFTRKLAPDTASKTFILLAFSFLVAAAAYYYLQQPYRDIIRENGSDAMTWFSIALFFHSRITEQRQENLEARG